MSEKKIATRGGSAVMSNRVEAPDSLDFFPTPPWAARLFLEHALGGRDKLSDLSVWEPACGQGHIAEPCREYFKNVYASDVYPYGYGEAGDFLDHSLGTFWQPPEQVDWIITNPPFNTATDFLKRAINSYSPNKGIALLMRLVWLEGKERYEQIFSGSKRPDEVWISSERIPMLRGRYEADAKSATSYAWFVWRMTDFPDDGPLLRWLPPIGRAQYFKASDVLIGQPVDPVQAAQGDML